MQQFLLLGRADRRAYFLRNFLSVLVFGTDNIVQLRRTEVARGRTNFCHLFDNF